jgi:A/G-specific adenine glycosylase
VEAFARALIAWYRRAHRDLPWRRTRDPWRILVSEVMLQQTRAAAVIPYYQRFLDRFPDAKSLAEAPEAELLAMWAGLGYYSRARNLQRAAQRVVEAGAFPQSYEAIRALPGVGGYTAAAVASIAFGLPFAVLDGNVIRVAARLSAHRGDAGASRTKNDLQSYVDGLLDRADPGSFNQAMMELGATLCIPKSPQCLLCPVAEFCQARQEGIQGSLPVKGRKAAPIAETKTVLVIRNQDSIVLKQRGPEERRLAGFWELPEPGEIAAASLEEEIGTIRHGIVNHSYTICVRLASFSRSRRLPRGFRWVNGEERGGLPLTTVTKKALSLLK